MPSFMAGHIPMFIAAVQPSLPPLSNMLLAGGVLLITMWALFSLRRRITRRLAEAASATPRERVQRAQTRAAERETIESLMVDAEELTRRLAALMDNKAARLERLIAEAEHLVGRLESATAENAQRRPDFPGPLRRPGANLSSNTGGGTALAMTADPLTRRVCELADAGLAPVEIAQRLEEQVGKVELILALREP